jgi:hypothetical protein
MRVLSWHYTDENDKVETAYLSCEHCGGELKQDTLKNAVLLDRSTKETVHEFRLKLGNETRNRRVGLIACPFLRRVKRSIAVRFADDAINCDNPKDFLEQSLGIASNDVFGSLTPEQILSAIKADKEPKSLEQYTTRKFFGLDVARSSHYGCSMTAFIPNTGSNEYRYNNTIRVVNSFDRLSSQAIAEYWRSNKFDAGAVDFNPDATLALELSTKLGIDVMVQKHNLREMFKEDREVEAGGIELNTFSFNNQYFINRLINNFKRTNGDELILRLPYLLEPEIRSTERQKPVAHFLNMTFDEDKGMWVKGKANRSDWFYSLLFAEVSLYHYIFSTRDLSWMDFY